MDEHSKKTETSVPKSIKVKQLQRELKTETAKWYELGFQLKVPTTVLKKIESDARKPPPVCFKEALDYWLKNGEDRTWQVVFDALEDGHGRLMRQLQAQYHEDMEVELNSTQLVNLLADVTPEWYMFGQNVDVPVAQLKVIKDSKEPDQCFSEMLRHWINSEQATWEGLVSALIHINNRKLAREIEKKYLKDIPDDPKAQRQKWYIGVSTKELEDEKDFFDVLNAVTSVVKWEELGLALKLKPSQLHEFRKDHRETAECRKAMVRAWLKEGEATWKSLCLALDNNLVGENKLARDIAKEHKEDENKEGENEHVNVSMPVSESATDVPHQLCYQGSVGHDSHSMQSPMPSAPEMPSQQQGLESPMETEDGSIEMQYESAGSRSIGPHHPSLPTNQPHYPVQQTGDTAAPVFHHLHMPNMPPAQPFPNMGSNVPMGTGIPSSLHGSVNNPQHSHHLHQSHGTLGVGSGQQPLQSHSGASVSRYSNPQVTVATNQHNPEEGPHSFVVGGSKTSVGPPKTQNTVQTVGSGGSVVTNALQPHDPVQAGSIGQQEFVNDQYSGHYVVDRTSNMYQSAKTVVDKQL